MYVHTSRGLFITHNMWKLSLWHNKPILYVIFTTWSGYTILVIMYIIENLNYINCGEFYSSTCKIKLLKVVYIVIFSCTKLYCLLKSCYCSNCGGTTTTHRVMNHRAIVEFPNNSKGSTPVTGWTPVTKENYIVKQIGRMFVISISWFL